MLQTDTRELETVRYGFEQDTLQYRWDILRGKVFSLIDYRLDHGSTIEWYQQSNEQMRIFYEGADCLDDPCQVNRLPSGILGEIFFMDACTELGLHCSPTDGDEDAWGADFKIGENGDTRFLDVSLNLSSNGLWKKNRAGTFPTLFIPWRIDFNNQRTSPSFALEYLSTGVFDTERFVGNILRYNYYNLHVLRQSVWKDARWGEGYMCLYGISYIRNLEGILKILRSRQEVTY